MKFITVIVVLLIYKNWWGGNPVRDVVSVDGWFQWIEGVVSERKLRYVCAVIVPSLILFWVSIVTADWILGLVYLVLSVVTVLYAIECIDFDGIFDEYRLSVRSGSQSGEDAKQKHDEFCTDVTYAAFQSFAPAVFWFLLLGPAGALLYAFTEQYTERHPAEDDENEEILEQILYWMEWFPARITGFVFTLLGGFRHGIAALAASVTDTGSPVATTLSEVVRGSLQVEQNEDIDEELTELQWLLEASIWGWVAFAALLTILGW